jgi:dTDP-4-dehydrorhamnose 3,5-epimerase
MMNGLFQELSAPLPGVRLLEPRAHRDERGSFVKTFHADAWREAGLELAMREDYYSVSGRHVLRGMHFQVPPESHTKMVYCVSGRVLDVLLDLRRSSPSFGQCAGREFSAANRWMLLIPPGIAHGFLSLADEATMVYKTTTVHSPAHDAGIRWDSFGYNWGLSSPLVSPRDASFPGLAEFDTPFP